MSHSTLLLPHAEARRLDASRLQRLMDELAFAVGRADRGVLQAWGQRSASRLVLLGGRRVGALGRLAARIGRAGADEVLGLMAALKAGRFSGRLGDRTAAAIDGSMALGRGGARLVGGVGHALMVDPRTNAPRMLAACMGFYAGSGGVDGDGGIPDLDLLAGIDAHRSLLTHSILVAVLAEGTLLAIADLAGEIHDRLPVDHDPLWDALARAASPLTGALTAGASAGIAYHLLWDAAIEPAPYKGLPFSMSMEAHQTVMGLNGVAEAAYVAQRAGRREPVLLHQGPPAGPSAGRKVVDGIARTAAHARERCRTMFGRFGKAPGG